MDVAGGLHARPDISLRGKNMVAHVYTVAFQGIEAREVDVQVHVANQSSINNPFSIVGLADKAVAESRERVRAALSAIGLALPHQKITINLAPADLPKEGSHYDLPIALGLLGPRSLICTVGSNSFSVASQWSKSITRWRSSSRNRSISVASLMRF